MSADNSSDQISLLNSSRSAERQWVFVVKLCGRVEGLCESLKRRKAESSFGLGS